MNKLNDTSYDLKTTYQHFKLETNLITFPKKQIPGLFQKNEDGIQRKKAKPRAKSVVLLSWASGLQHQPMAVAWALLVFGRFFFFLGVLF